MEANIKREITLSTDWKNPSNVSFVRFQHDKTRKYSMNLVLLVEQELLALPKPLN